MIPYIILVLIIILIILIDKYKNMNYDFNSILIRIHDGENEIDELLKRKLELLNEIFEGINNINDNKVFSLIKNKNSLDSQKLDRELAENYSELKEYLLVNKSFIPEDDLKDKIDELSQLEINLEASKLFYNDNSSTFNKLIDKFPTKMIANKKGYDFKFLYTFEKEEFFEILKDDKKQEKEA